MQRDLFAGDERLWRYLYKQIRRIEYGNFKYIINYARHEIVTLLGYMTMVSVVVDKAGAVIEVMIKRHKEAKIRRMKEKAEIYKNLLK